MASSGQAEGHPPQALLPPGLKPSQGQEVMAVCRVRPQGGNLVFQPIWGQLLRGCPGLGKERAGLGAWPLQGLGGQSPGEGLIQVQGPGTAGLVPGMAFGVLESGPLGARHTWDLCRRSRKPLVGFPQRTGPAPGEEDASGPGLGLRGCRASFMLR